MEMTLKESVDIVVGLARDASITGFDDQAIDQVVEFFNEYFRNYPDHD